jgi:hypothetical protein
MSTFIRFLSVIYAILHDNKPIEKKYFGVPKKEIFNSKTSSYEIMSSPFYYIIKGRFFWVPNRRSHGVSVRGRLYIKGQEGYTDLGGIDYPLLVPRYLMNSNVLHILVRRRYISDVSEMLNKNDLG